MITEQDERFLNSPSAIRLRAGLNLAKRWSLGTSQVIAVLALTEDQSQRLGDTDVLVETLRPDQIERLDLLLSIHASLKPLFTEDERVYGWMRKPNGAFGGISAIDVCLRDGKEGIETVQSYLAAVVAG
ncbi:MbcA/ParS/Xre antitoxin family protein [Hyphomonas sp.]|jgi:Antitoxin Xre/MbcA/ParS C-terminal toxin-binding domain|uniref:MbcA/ParS/Xre antitoxin family protein n=1 Tax=Hyphomonas sp. TaxID=87 RepID=UPI002619FDF5|nr:MbcA/ParS/Xre antitoxin family protein [Hyphomonas sp.]MDF1807795.1 MbcA/ParS/Xre antitoxin family protein [Hyphomonas sp.]